MKKKPRSYNLIDCAFGSTFDRIDSKRINYDRIDSDRIDFDIIDLCLDTIM